MQGVYIYGLAIRDDDLVSRVPLDNMCLSQVYEALRMVSAFFFIFSQFFILNYMKQWKFEVKLFNTRVVKYITEASTTALWTRNLSCFISPSPMYLFTRHIFMIIYLLDIFS